MDVFNERPGGGAREAKPFALGQVRAIWPKRPQFCDERLQSENKVLDGKRARYRLQMATHVAFLASACTLDPEAGALSLDVSDTPAGVALLGGSGAGRGTGSRLMPRLAAIVAETLS